MDWRKEVLGWINTIQQEVQGLDEISERLNASRDNSPQLIIRFQKVIALLKEGMENLIDKSNSFLKFQSEPGNKLTQLRDEYQKAMKSLTSLFKSMNESSCQPHYNFSTYASRKRSLSKKEISTTRQETARMRNKSNTSKNNTNREENEKEVETLKRDRSKEKEKSGYKDVKISLNRIRDMISKHKHQEYEERIMQIERENAEIKRKLQEATREAEENLESIREIEAKIEFLERNKNTKVKEEIQEKKKRFLLRTPNESADISLLSNRGE